MLCGFKILVEKYYWLKNERYCLKKAKHREIGTNNYFCEEHKFEDMDRKHSETGSSNPDYDQEDYEDQYEKVGK